MRSVINLRILEKEFSQLSESAYFDEDFREFVIRSTGAIRHVLSELDHYPVAVVKGFELHLWNARKFIKGTRSSDAPYEVQFALRAALNDWIPGQVLLSYAALEDMSFFLNLTDLWKFINGSLDRFDTEGYSPLVVRIGTPDVFKHRPTFCTPLFHELGHFIDIQAKVSELSMLLDPPALPDGMTSTQHARLMQTHQFHRMEHFADIFAACYCGDALNHTLGYIAKDNPASDTHPATSDRIELVSDFLQGTDKPITALLKKAFKIRTGGELEPKYSVPEISNFFDDVLTYPIGSKRELFGLFQASWRYLEAQLDKPTAPWIEAQTSEFIIEKTVNDLTEKSLRNYEVRERWSNVPSL
ncbi:hypothetical protein [Sulfitobacter sp. PS-8MA]|uniref:hypothetical protein n=1 Tax=Sulfitobacter sp. PS-8MA TaxID=3237707 RepID=UPI0034C5BD60